MEKIIIGTLCSTILLGGVILPTTSVFSEEAGSKGLSKKDTPKTMNYFVPASFLY
jgi:hypothetical protein